MKWSSAVTAYVKAQNTSVQGRSELASMVTSTVVRAIF